jgi:hypothetical protein
MPIIISFILLLAGCGAQPVPTPVQYDKPAAHHEPTAHHDRPADAAHHVAGTKGEIEKRLREIDSAVQDAKQRVTAHEKEGN